MEIRKKIFAFIAPLIFVLAILPAAVLALDTPQPSYWYQTNLHIYVHKDLNKFDYADSPYSDVYFLSNPCYAGQPTGLKNTSTCPGVGFFLYKVGDPKASPAGKKTKATADFPYDIYETSIDRGAGHQLEGNYGIIALPPNNEKPDTESYNWYTSKIMNNTVFTIEKNGEGSNTAPPGVKNDPYKAPLPVTPPDTSDPGTKTPAAEAATVTIGGISVPEPGLDSGQCPEGSEVFTSGLLKGIPCTGSVDSLEEVLLIVRNLVMSFILPAVGTIFTIMMIVGGILYITSRGNEKQSTRAKQTLTAAIIGLLIVTLSYTIITIFTGIIGGGIS